MTWSNKGETTRYVGISPVLPETVHLIPFPHPGEPPKNKHANQGEQTPSSNNNQFSSKGKIKIKNPLKNIPYLSPFIKTSVRTEKFCPFSVCHMVCISSSLFAESWRHSLMAPSKLPENRNLSLCVKARHRIPSSWALFLTNRIFGAFVIINSGQTPDNRV